MSKLDRPIPQSPVKNGDSEGTEIRISSTWRKPQQAVIDALIKGEVELQDVAFKVVRGTGDGLINVNDEIKIATVFQISLDEGILKIIPIF